MNAGRIFDAVMQALQNADEIGGPEGAEYVDLMRRIATEATRRAATCAANLNDGAQL